MTKRGAEVVPSEREDIGVAGVVADDQAGEVVEEDDDSDESVVSAVSTAAASASRRLRSDGLEAFFVDGESDRELW